MIKMKTALGLILGAGVLACTTNAQETAPAPEPITVIHAGNLLAVPGEGYLREQTITVQGNQIVSVSSGYTVPSGATVIDLKDAYVLPGLIDSHVHITSENGPGGRLKTFTNSAVDTAFEGAAFANKTLQAGFTTVQDVGGMNEAVFGLRDAIRSGAVPGPRIRTSGHSVSVTGGHGDTNGYSSPVLKFLERDSTCDGADDCRRAVRQQVKEGADVIKITATGGVLSNTSAGLEQQFSDAELEAIVDAAHAMGRKVTAHAHGKGGIEAALRAGVDSIEHGTYLDDESIALFKEKNATLVPTILAGVTVTGWTNEPWLPEASRKKAAVVGPLMLDMAARAHAGGVNIAYGTDTGVSAHGDNALEFALMVQAGFTPEEAIRAATVIASQHVQMDAQIGTITTDKLADIIAVTSDPLNDITQLERVDFVMKDGLVHKQ